MKISQRPLALVKRLFSMFSCCSDWRRP